MNFVVFALPRSRTHWMQAYLTVHGWHVGHDEVRHFRSLQDVRSWFSQDLVGSVETAAAPFWRLLPEGVRVAVVRRPVAEVADSLIRQGVPLDATSVQRLRHMDQKLIQIVHRLPNVAEISFAELATEAGCKLLFEHCLGVPHDHGWWERCAPINVQEPLSVPFRYVQAYKPQLHRMARLAKHRILADMRKPLEHEGFVFSTEPFREFRESCAQLITNHCVESGRAPWHDFNVPMFQWLDDAGALQVMTARSNGRCFGYLVSIVGPSLEGQGVTQATHTGFYTDPSVRGLGVRLLMRANEALRQKGVHEIIMRAGVAGSGPRMGAVYHRLGASPFGELWKLEA